MEHNITTITKPKFFKDLKIGDVFTWNLPQSGSIFIKIEKVDVSSMGSTRIINAVNLITGNTTFFYENEKIFKIINPVINGEVEE